MFVRTAADASSRLHSLRELGLNTDSNPIISLNEFTYKKGSEVYGEKEPAEYVYQVKKGAVRSYKLLSDGRRQIDEGGLGLGRDDAGDGSDLGVGELPRAQGLGDAGIVQQRPADPHLVLGGAHADAAVPVQPEGGAAALPSLIALALVELADQEQPPAHPRRPQLPTRLQQAYDFQDAAQSGLCGRPASSPEGAADLA